MLLKQDSFVRKVCNVVVEQNKIRKVESTVVPTFNRLTTIHSSQTELRKARLIRRENGESSISLHDTALEIPSQMPSLSEEFFDETVNDAMRQFLADETGTTKPWFSNGRTTIQKIEADVQCVSHLLACIFIHDEQWMKIVESHNSNLHGGEQPMMDVKLMEAYFGDIPSIRSKAFDLVCLRRS